MKIKTLKEYKLKGERNNRPRQPLLVGDKVLLIFVYDKKGFVESRIQCLKAADFSLVWEYQHNHVINNLVLAQNKTVICSCMNGEVKCFDIDNGKEVWIFATNESNIGALSNLDKDKFIVSGIQARAGSTWCIDANSGSVVWQATNKGHSYIPIIHQGYAYNCIEREINCLNMSDGSTVWTNTEPETYIFNPKVFNKYVVASGHGVVNFYDLMTGRQINSIHTGERESIREIIHNGSEFFFGDEKGMFYSYNCSNADGDTPPALNWKVDTGGSIQSIPAIKDGKVLVMSDAKKMFVIDEKSGEVEYEMKIKGEASISGITQRDNKIYFSCGGGCLYEAKLDG